MTQEGRGCLGTLDARADSLQRQVTNGDMEIIALIRQRTHLAALAAAAHRRDYHTSFSHQRDLNAMRRYSQLGACGRDIGLRLLDLARASHSRVPTQQSGDLA